MAASDAAPNEYSRAVKGRKRSGLPLTAPFAAAYGPIAAENCHPSGHGRKCVKGRAKFTCANWNGLSGIQRTWKIGIRARRDFGAARGVVFPAESLKSGSYFPAQCSRMGRVVAFLSCLERRSHGLLCRAERVLRTLLLLNVHFCSDPALSNR